MTTASQTTEWETSIGKLLADTDATQERGLQSFDVLGNLVAMANRDHPGRAMAQRILVRLVRAIERHDDVPTDAELAPEFGAAAAAVRDLWPALQALKVSRRQFERGSRVEECHESVWREAGAVAVLTSPGTRGMEFLHTLADERLERVAAKARIARDELVNATVERLANRTAPTRSYRPQGYVGNALKYAKAALVRRSFDEIPRLAAPRGAGSVRDRKLSGPRKKSLPLGRESEAYFADIEADVSLTEPLPPGTVRRWKSIYRTLKAEPKHEEFELSDLFGQLFGKESCRHNDSAVIERIRELLARRRQHRLHVGNSPASMTIGTLAKALGIERHRVWTAFRRARAQGAITPVKDKARQWRLGREEIEVLRQYLNAG